MTLAPLSSLGLVHHNPIYSLRWANVVMQSSGAKDLCNLQPIAQVLRYVQDNIAALLGLLWVSTRKPGDMPQRHEFRLEYTSRRRNNHIVSNRLESPHQPRVWQPLCLFI